MGLDRRGFIQFLVGGAVGSLFTPIPWKLTDDLAIWTQNWPWIPRNLKGDSEYVKTVSKLCPTNCALNVRTVAGNPIRAIGDKDNPLSGGALSSMAAAEVQLLYSPARLKRPLLKSDDDAFLAISWEQAFAIMEEKLGSIKGVQGKLAVVSGDQNGTVNEVLAGFCSLAGSDNFFIMPCEAHNANRVWRTKLRNAGLMGYDLENSDYVLAIGADILESWGPAIRNRRVFSSKRPHGADPKAMYVYAGPVQNNTAVGADQWMPIKPGTEAVLAAALANLLIKKGRSFESMEFEDFKDAVSAIDLAKAAAITGLPEKSITLLAEQILKASHPAIIVDSSFNQGAGAAPIMAGIGLNLLANGINKKGGMVALPEIPQVVKAAPRSAVMFKQDLVKSLTSGKLQPEMLIVYEANPVYALPQSANMAQAMSEIPFKVSFSSFLDETAMACDLVLPMPLGLERYDDVCTPFAMNASIYCPVHPVIAPLVDAPMAADVLIALGKRLGMDIGYETFKDVLDAKAQMIGETFDGLQGKYAQAPSLEDIGMPSVGAEPLRKALKAAAPQDALQLAPMNKLNYGTATTSTPPFNLKTVRNTVLLDDKSFVHVNSATASKLGVNEGDFVKVSSEVGECPALVHIDEGVMSGVVAAPLGFGHTAFDDFTRGKGSNTAQLMQVAVEAGSGFPVWTSTAVKIAKI